MVSKTSSKAGVVDQVMALQDQRVWPRGQQMEEYLNVKPVWIRVP
jgi:hypothetical protein